MKSKVYFTSVNNTDSIQVIQEKLGQLMETSKIFDFIRKDDRVALKMHFGEEGNTGYVRPEYIRVISDHLAKKQAKHFLSDTNTLYRGMRMNLQDHLNLAYEHGFTEEACGCPILIPDDTKKENAAEVCIDQKFIKIAKIARPFQEAGAILGIAHFKGHMMTGFGGALKNIGMGCATKEGKLAQHSDISPFVIVEECTACAECLETCPVEAIFMQESRAYIDPVKCIGCASCIGACLQNAIEVNWEAGGGNVQEKMVEYAKAVLKDKQGNSAFINFATKITKECDCLAKDDPRIVPDVGILVSRDPVSIDQASLELIKKSAGRDIFKEIHPLRDGLKQLKYASELGLGNLEYELIEMKFRDTL